MNQSCPDAVISSEAACDVWDQEDIGRRARGDGSIEPRFYKALMGKLGLHADATPQHDPNAWDSMREVLTRTFRTKTRDEWCSFFDGTDVCFSPVLSPSEAVTHPHNVARQHSQKFQA